MLCQRRANTFLLRKFTYEPPSRSRQLTMCYRLTPNYSQGCAMPGVRKARHLKNWANAQKDFHNYEYW